MPDLVSDGAGRSATGLALFVAFGLFFEGVIGLSGDPFLLGSELLPIALIGLGGRRSWAGACCGAAGRRLDAIDERQARSRRPPIAGGAQRA